MPDDDRLVVKGVPPELRDRLRVAAAEDHCYPRDIVIKAVAAWLLARDAGAAVTAPADTGGQ